MKEYPWFRLYTEMIYDEKIRVAADRLDYSYLEILGAWVVMLSLASRSPVRGSLYVTSTIPYENKDIAKACDITIKSAIEIISMFIELEMLEDGDGGAIMIKNWDNRQYENTEEKKVAHAQYVRDWRNHKKVSQINHNPITTTITNLSPSVSVSVSESLINDSLTEKSFFTISDSEKALTKATNFFPLPQTYTPYLEKVLDLLQHNGWDDTVERLTRAKDNWVSQKRSINGANYKLTNPAWIDYAITGETVGAKVLTEQERIHQELAELAKKTEYQG
jgi:hypothetical protein